MAKLLENKIFNDPIHGTIELPPLCVRIIDTEQFQRLRFIKQLGGNYFVYPGASHNRFEHSIGVCHLAGNMIKHLRSNQPELKITDEDILCVQIAGLCHDLGHGPFSHMYEVFVRTINSQSTWRHEDASAEMFDHLLKENGISLTDFSLNEEDANFITQLFHPPDENGYIGRGKEKPFLYQIVSNKNSGVDVDKWDYFARDCHHLGMASMFDHERLIKFSRVVEQQICFRDKEIGNIYEMFHIRQTLHRKAYKHKTTNSVEQMIVDAFVKADPFVKIQYGSETYKPSECIHHMEAYTNLTDYLYQMILLGSDPNLAPARNILLRIAKRDLYSLVGEARPRKGITIEKQDIISGMSSLEDAPNEDTYVVQTTKFNYGMAANDPVDHVKFYTKESPDTAITKGKSTESFMLPEVFEEQLIRVYCRSDKKADDFTTIRKCFENWCDKNENVDMIR